MIKKGLRIEMINNSVICGDCLEVLRGFPDESINCCVTSPPYWGLRSYLPSEHKDKSLELGCEKTPEEYVSNMVEVFREVKRVLRADGTCWINLGDSYAGSGGAHKKHHANPGISNSFKRNGVPHWGDLNQPGNYIAPKGMKPKDLVGIPWMVAFALRADGWYLRSDIIWHKPNPMPESVTDRPTKSHEYIFLLSKSQKYYYDHEAIGTPIKQDTVKRYERAWNGDGERGFPNGPQNHIKKFMDPSNEKRLWANKKSVWTVNTRSFKKAHFATFPTKLIEPCILAGCPKGGIVLDPFMGAGTVAYVAKENNRNYIGCELNPEYIKIAETRIKNAQLSLF